MGINRCATEAADVRELWTRLLILESECEDVLRGAPSTVLEVPDVSVSLDGATLRISVGSPAGEGAKVVAVPRFTFDCTPRKLNNFGHWSSTACHRWRRSPPWRPMDWCWFQRG